MLSYASPANTQKHNHFLLVTYLHTQGFGGAGGTPTHTMLGEAHLQTMCWVDVLTLYQTLSGGRSLSKAAGVCEFLFQVQGRGGRHSDDCARGVGGRGREEGMKIPILSSAPSSMQWLTRVIDTLAGQFQ